MLEPWIIEQIRRREEEERRRQEERPVLEIPMSDDLWPTRRESEKKDDEETPKRGVVIIGI